MIFHIELTRLDKITMHSLSPLFSFLSRSKEAGGFDDLLRDNDVNFEANRDLYDDDLLEPPDDDLMYPKEPSSTTSSRIKEIITLPMSKSVKMVFDIDIDDEDEDTDDPLKEGATLDGGKVQEEEHDEEVDHSSAVILGTRLQPQPASYP